MTENRGQTFQWYLDIKAKNRLTLKGVYSNKANNLMSYLSVCLVRVALISFPSRRKPFMAFFCTNNVKLSQLSEYAKTVLFSESILYIIIF